VPLTFPMGKYEMDGRIYELIVHVGDDKFAILERSEDEEVKEFNRKVSKVVMGKESDELTFVFPLGFFKDVCKDLKSVLVDKSDLADSSKRGRSADDRSTQHERIGGEDQK